MFDSNFKYKKYRNQIYFLKIINYYFDNQKKKNLITKTKYTMVVAHQLSVVLSPSSSQLPNDPSFVEFILHALNMQ